MIEHDRDLRTRVTNKRTDTNVIFGQYDYRYDVAGRRKDLVYSGTAFAAGHLFKWGYGDAAYNRGELTGADRHLGTDRDSPGARMTRDDYGYVCDPIGNRDGCMQCLSDCGNPCTNELQEMQERLMRLEQLLEKYKLPDGKG